MKPRPDEEAIRRGTGTSKYLRESLPRRLSPGGNRRTSATEEREKAAEAAAFDFAKALAWARKVPEPWFRCQALAWVARYAPDGDVVRVANEAVKTAMQGKDEYQRVAVCAWPLRALSERKKTTRTLRLVAEILPMAASISHPVNRLEALFLLWQAAAGLSLLVKQRILDALVDACSSANSWKAGRTIRDVSQILAAEDVEQAHRIVASMPASAYKRQAQKWLAAGQTGEARGFFRGSERWR